jgi:hypothetical protein
VICGPIESLAAALALSSRIAPAELIVFVGNRLIHSIKAASLSHRVQQFPLATKKHRAPITAPRASQACITVAGESVASPKNQPSHDFLAALNSEMAVSDFFWLLFGWNEVVGCRSIQTNHL